MTIRYNRAVVLPVFACVAITVALTVIKIGSGRWSLLDTGLDVVSVAVFTAIGIRLLVRPLAELTDTELTVNALFGSRRARYSADQLRVVQGRVYCGDKPVLDRWSTKHDDWRSLVQRVHARGA